MNQTSPARLIGCCAGLAAALTLLGACSEKQAQQVEPQPLPRAVRPPLEPKNLRPVSEQIGSVYSAAAPGRGPELISRERLSGHATDDGLVEPTLLSPQQGELIGVQYSTKDADVTQVMHVLLGEYLERDYVIDPRVTGLITMDIDQEMTREDIRDLIGGLCMLYGWSIEDREGIVYIRQAAAAPRSPMAPILQAQAAFESDEPAIRVRRLRHITADQIANIVKDLMTENASKAIVSGRTVVLVDTVRQLNKVSRLISALDVPAFDGVELWTYRLGSKRPDDAAELLTKLAQATRLTGETDPMVAFLPIVGTDRLLVISRDASLQPLVHSFIEQVDRPTNAMQRQRYVYRIQHLDPTSLENLIKGFFGDQIEAQVTPGAAARQTDGGNKMRVVLLREEAQLLVMATPADYAELYETLKVIDRPRQQVALNSVIAEVVLNDALEYGVEYFLRAINEDGFGILELAGTPGLPVDPTGSAFFVGGDGLAIVQALQRVGDVKIVSRPNLTVRDGDTATIQVGGETPIVIADQDSTAQTDGNTAIRREIEYRDTGVLLTIEPTLNETGLVTLKIVEDITNVGGQTDLGPEFTTRKLETTVTVPHGYTLLLGGIIEDEYRDDVDKIPILGDIPLVGLAFQSRNKRTLRRELVLAITPTLINEPNDGAELISDFLRSATTVRSALFELENELIEGTLQGVDRGEPWVESDDGPEEAPGLDNEGPGTSEDTPDNAGSDDVVDAMDQTATTVDSEMP